VTREDADAGDGADAAASADAGSGSEADPDREPTPATDGGTGDGEPVAPRRSDAAPDNGLAGPSPTERPHPEGRRNDQGIRIDPVVEAERSSRTAVISALVANEPGVLSRVSGLFSRRQFNIESLTVGPTENTDYSRITLVVEEPEPEIDQIKKQLEKLVPVASARELDRDAIRRELALLKVDGTEPDRVAAVAEMYGGTAVDASPETVTVEVTGSHQKVEAAIETFQQFGVREIKRTGTAALERGARTTAGDDVPVPAASATDGRAETETETETAAEAER
jgi:acetolactate synthase-1/3 small subunit